MAHLDSTIYSHKTCNRCFALLPLEAFQFVRRDGYSAGCKACLNAEQNARYRAAHPARPKEATEQQCTLCAQTKPLDAFSRNKHGRYGRASQCKECRNARQHERREANAEREREEARQWREQHRDDLRRYHRAYYEAHIERHKALARAWREEHSEAMKESRAQHYRINRERYIERARERARTHPDETRLHGRRMGYRRRALLKGNGSHTHQEWLDLCALYDYRCLCCGHQKPLTYDHVIPVTKGGSDDISNAQPLCLQCNTAKGTKATDYRPAWLAQHDQITPA